MPTLRASVAVIGGSGFYEFFDEAQEVKVETPYGASAAPIAVGRMGGPDGTTVAFLPRHGKEHAYPPHLINYRANLWALASLGVRQVLAPCAVGGLRAGGGRSGADGGHDVAPGDIVIPDQLVDRTQNRAQSFVEEGVVHVPFADPYCPTLSAAAARAPGVTHGGTMVVVEGPRFSTRAESQHYAAQGWTLVNMTGHPEAVLARELRMCYAAVALVTDMDAGAHPGESVGQEGVFATFARNIDRLKALLTDVVGDLPEPGAGCACASWADGIDLPYAIPGGIS